MKDPEACLGCQRPVITLKCSDIFNQIYIEYRHSSVATADEFEIFQLFMHLSLPDARAFGWASLHACRLA